MRPVLQLFIGLAAAIGLLAQAPLAGALPDIEAPIGHLGDTLRAAYVYPASDVDVAADVTVHRIEPTGVPAGMAPPRGIIWKAYVTVHTLKTPNPHALIMDFKFGAISPETGDAYEPQHTDEPDDLNYALLNAPAGSTVNGAVYWDVYRGPIRFVVLRSRQTDVHLAQWNL